MASANGGSEHDFSLSQLMMEEIHDLYTPPDDDEDDEGIPAALGLETIASEFGVPISRVYLKSSVLVIGNVSAGKSTFINWYVQEALQKTGMAIETSGFTVVTEGKAVTELKGESTALLVPYFQELVHKYPGLLENLSCKTCPSNKLQLLNLIDSPGLADGDLQYPFDIEQAILDLADHVDLICVFFDPIGQALGRRLMQAVQALDARHPDKMRYCLTKVDDVPSEEDRIKVTCQTTQSLTSKINVKHGFDLIPIFVPGAKDGSYLIKRREVALDPPGPLGTVNRLKHLCSEVERCVHRKVQDALTALNKDCTALGKAVDAQLEADRARRAHNEAVNAKRLRCYLWICFSVVLLLVAGVARLAEMRYHPAPSQGHAHGRGHHNQQHQQSQWSEGLDELGLGAALQAAEEVLPLHALGSLVHAAPWVLMALLGLAGAIAVVSGIYLLFVLKRQAVLPRPALGAMQEKRAYVRGCLKAWKQLHSRYLERTTVGGRRSTAAASAAQRAGRRASVSDGEDEGGVDTIPAASNAKGDAARRRQQAASKGEEDD